ncbi:hypothetical protein [Streptomyces abikoensis]|uniref:hypothetical protein n=1 Tax=Streptomyces abikoensis TaxID=97398 RepID=UPI001675595D|nr:hypothetical protein [Streptomyces abikoensis]GGP59202.1 hypothetical protein GCM10010214_36210 [Streptomyces abikoensis]
MRKLAVTAERVLEILRHYDPVGWMKVSMGRHPLEGYLQAPFIAWRFQSPRKELQDLFEEAIRESSGRVEWVLDTSGKNWILAPSRLLAGVAERGRPGFSDVVASITLSDQPFCAAATADMEGILQFLAHGGEVSPEGE